MNPLFVDIYLAIYYNTNEPIDGNLLRMMTAFDINKNCANSDHNCKCIGCVLGWNIDILRKAKERIDCYKFKTLLPLTIDPVDLTTPCGINIYGSNKKAYTEVIMIAVRPEYIKFALNNIDIIFDGMSKTGPEYIYSYKYVEYYKYLENCMHPDKLGTVNFIIEPKQYNIVETLEEKIDKLIIKLDLYDESNTITNNRLKYLLSLIK
jgi:hypothetical protein